jgi:hypothetical protein
MLTGLDELCAADIWYKFNELRIKNISEGALCRYKR